MPQERQFPIQATNTYDGRPATIDWSVAEIAVAEHRLQNGPAQAIEDYARRGGFGVWELAKLLGQAAQRQRREPGPSVGVRPSDRPFG